MVVPRILPSQLRFDCFAESKGTLFRGLFVTSWIKGVDRTAVWRFGDDRTLLRMGVKPDWRLLNILRTLGVVVSFSLLGRLSTVKPCGGTVSQASKSSGARRFTPTTEGGGAEVRSWARRCSGVRSLKTGVGASRLSGVFGRTVPVGGPEATRDDDLETWAVGGFSWDEDTVVLVDWRDDLRRAVGAWISAASARGVGEGLVDAGTASAVTLELATAAFAAASLVCRFCAFRVNVSTLADSFLFSFSILRTVSHCST